MRSWRVLGPTTVQRLGKLMLREEAWRLPTGAERRALPFAEAVAMALDDRITNRRRRSPPRCRARA